MAETALSLGQLTTPVDGLDHPEGVACGAAGRLGEPLPMVDMPGMASACVILS